MSMLEKILQDMYIEPELLNELDEEQKQILFCKMREEQLRRWATREKEYEEQQKFSPKVPSGRRVQWLVGEDGLPWTWVMGEHEDDKTIEEIMENEAQETARRLAEKEAEELRHQQEEELKEKLRVQGFDGEDHDDDEDRSSWCSTFPSFAELQRPTAPDNFSHEKSFHFDTGEAESSSHTNFTNNSSSTPNQSLATTEPIRKDENALSISANSVVNDEVHALLETLKQAKLTVAQHGVNDSAHLPTLNHQASESDLIKEREALELKLRVEAERRIQEEKERRQSEIYQSLKEARERVNKEAEREEQEEQRYWEQQERKSREAEEQIRDIARRAREQHRQQELRTSSSIQVALHHIKPKAATSTHILKLPRPPRPKSHSAIVQWFLKNELPRGTGLDPKTGLVAPWFHGIISRENAESLLRDRSWGSFLVRVSEKIWGFTLSYSNGKDTMKHFLIERTEEGYQFLGTNQIVHKQLWDLVSYHEV